MFILKTAVASAAILLTAGAPVQAQPVPEGPVMLYLKDHQEIPLAVVDGVPRLSSEGDHWELNREILQNLGEVQIVHQETGQCLAVDTNRGGETAKVRLRDCDTAHAWTIFYHNPGHKDFRFVADGEYLLGLYERSDAVEGAEILAIREDPSDSKHFHEWLTEAGNEDAAPPPSLDAAAPADPADPADPASAMPSEVAPVSVPKLPTTGTGLGIAIGAAAAALVGGTALVLWWQRRRALRAEW
jgi:hypothetical protein